MESRIGWLRIAVGLALCTAPEVLLRASTGERPSGSMLLLARTVGIRDLVLGAGTLSAARSGTPRDTRRWISAGLASDLLDAAASLAGAPRIGRRSAVLAAGITLPVIAAGSRALVATRPAAPENP